MPWAFAVLREYAVKHKKYSYEPKGRGFESLLARHESFGYFRPELSFF